MSRLNGPSLRYAYDPVLDMRASGHVDLRRPRERPPSIGRDEAAHARAIRRPGGEFSRIMPDGSVAAALAHQAGVGALPTQPKGYQAGARQRGKARSTGAPGADARPTVDVSAAAAAGTVANGGSASLPTVPEQSSPTSHSGGVYAQVMEKEPSPEEGHTSPPYPLYGRTSRGTLKRWEDARPWARPSREASRGSVARASAGAAHSSHSTGARPTDTPGAGTPGAGAGPRGSDTTPEASVARRQRRRGPTAMLDDDAGGVPGLAQRIEGHGGGYDSGGGSGSEADRAAEQEGRRRRKRQLVRSDGSLGSGSSAAPAARFAVSVDGGPSPGGFRTSGRGAKSAQDIVGKLNQLISVQEQHSTMPRSHSPLRLGLSQEEAQAQTPPSGSRRSRSHERLSAADDRSAHVPKHGRRARQGLWDSPTHASGGGLGSGSGTVGAVSRARAAPMRGRRRVREVGRARAPHSDGGKFRPNLEIVKHNMSPAVVATLRKDFVPRGAGDDGGFGGANGTDGGSGPGVGSPANKDGAVHYSLAHPPLLGQGASPKHSAAMLPAAARVAARRQKPSAHGFPSSSSFLVGPDSGQQTFGRLNPQRLAAEISRWLTGMGDFKKEYNSVSVFLQVKLAEIESLAGERKRPNVCRTAVAFGLLDILVSKLSTFSDTLLPLRTEMLQSVYPLEMLKQTALTWNTYDASGGTPARKLTTQETLEELFKCRTYFDLLAETKEQLRQARDALEAAVDAKDKEWRAIAHHRRVEAEKRSKLMARVFFAWKGEWAAAKQRKAILASQAKTRALIQGITKRDVFAAWYAQVLKSRNSRLDARANQGDSDLKITREQLAAALAAHAEAQRQLAAAQEQARLARERLTNVKTHAATLLRQQRRDVSALAGALRAAAEVNDSRCQDEVEEIKTMPDAAVVEQALTMKDVHPDKCGQEPYAYGGVGAPVGGGGDYSDVDISHLSADRAAMAEAQGMDPMEWALQDEATLAELRREAQEVADQHSQAVAQAGDAAVPAGAAGSGSNEGGGDSAPAADAAAAALTTGSGEAEGKTQAPGKGAARKLTIQTSFKAGALHGAAAGWNSARTGDEGADLTARTDASLVHQQVDAGETASVGADNVDDDGASVATDLDMSLLQIDGDESGTVTDAGTVNDSMDTGPGESKGPSGPKPSFLLSPGLRSLGLPSPLPSPMSVPDTPKSTGRGGPGKKGKKKKKASKKGKKKRRLKKDGSPTSRGTPVKRGSASSSFFGKPGDGESQYACVPASPKRPPPPPKMWERYSHEAVEEAAKRLAPDLLLMRWVNYHLTIARVKGEPVDKRVHNFGGDFIDGEALAVLLHNLAHPGIQDVRVVNAQDPSTRCELSIKQLRKFRPTGINFVTAEHVASGDAQIVAAVCGRLFSTHHGLRPPSSYTNAYEAAGARMRRAWAVLSEDVEATMEDHERQLRAFEQWDAVEGEPAPALGNTGEAHGDTAGSGDDASVLSDAEPVEGELVLGTVRADSPFQAPPKRSLAEKAADFVEALETAQAEVKHGLMRARRGHELYHHACHRVTEFVWQVFESKLLHLDRKVVDERVERDLTEYTKIYPAKYKDLLNKYCKNEQHAEEEVAAMESILKQYRGELMRIFKYYCASGDGASISTMCLSEYWTFLRQSRLATGGFGDKNSARLDLIFGKAKQQIGLPDENEVNPPNELIPRQWVETMVRVGVLLNEGRRPEPALRESLRMVVEEFVVPFATQSNTEAFREELQSKEVRDVIKKHRAALQRVFGYYCKQVTSVDDSTDSMNCDKFLKMLRDGHIIDRHLTPLVVKHVFALTQLEETFEDDCGGGGEDEMIYSEFLEGVCAVAIHKISNPYVAVSKRVDEFIEKHLLPRVKQLKPRRIRMRKGSVALTPVTPKSSRSRRASMDEVATEVIRAQLADRDSRGESEGKGEEAGAASGTTVGSVAGSPA